MDIVVRYDRTLLVADPRRAARRPPRRARAVNLSPPSHSFPRVVPPAAPPPQHGLHPPTRRRRRLWLHRPHPVTMFGIFAGIVASSAFAVSFAERRRLSDFVSGEPAFAEAGNVWIVRKSNLVTYRGPSMLASTLHAISMLLRTCEWDWFINLSASDYPLVTQDGSKILILVS